MLNIVFESNICLFENMSEIDIQEKMILYKQLFSEKILPVIKSVNFDSSKINQIKVIPLSDDLKYCGKAIPIIQNNELYFDILYTDKIFLWFSAPSNKKYVYAKSVIEHELYHCKEMLITSQYVNFKKLHFLDPINTSYKYVFGLAVRQLTEYYAYLNSAKTHSKLVDFGKTIEDSHANICILKDAAISAGDVVLIEEIKSVIDIYIDKCIIQIARYHATNDEKYIHVLDKYKDSKHYKQCYQYFLRIEKYLRTHFSEYPDRMSEEWLLSFGRELISIYSYYGLKFQTEDLSDNFVLISNS